MSNYRLPVICAIFCCFFFTTTATSPLLHTVTWNLCAKNGTRMTVKFDQAAQLVPHLNLQENTLIYCHGYTESTDATAVAALLNGLTAGTNFNIIAIDYRFISHLDYLTAVDNADGVATIIVHGITNMIAVGMDKTKLIASGLSLGAQICAFVGRKLLKSSLVLPKIIAMDPAGPLFNFTSPSLSASDAACVICIHTDMGFYGTTQPVNYIDIYPNGGTREQPGCSPLYLEYPGGSCSHIRSEVLMAEAANNPNTFIGVQCNSWVDFKAGNCNQTNKIPMGLFTPCSAAGKYYLQTNSASPFAKGSSGTVYQS